MDHFETFSFCYLRNYVESNFEGSLAAGISLNSVNHIELSVDIKRQVMSTTARH